MERPPFYDYLIIGGGIAGTTAAETIRLHDAQGSIGVITNESEPLYSRVLLPSYIRKKIEREKVFLRSEDHYTNRRIDYIVNEEVLSVNFDTHELLTKSERKIAFTKLLISTGGTPNKWNVKGGDHDRIVRMQTIKDADRVRALFLQAQEKGGGSTVVVGGGFIGLEFMETSVAYGFETHVILREQKIFGDLIDDQGWSMLLPSFERSRITIHPETEVRLIEDNAGNPVVKTNTRLNLEAQVVGCGIGIKRNLSAFEGMGLEIQKGIKTNQFLETSLPNVWAAGDVAEYFDEIFGEHRMIGNWTHAFLQGRAAGSCMAGVRNAFRMVSGYSITSLGKHFTTIGRVEGASEMDSFVKLWPGGQYLRVFFKDDLIQGALLIDRFQDKNALAKLIEDRATRTDAEKILASLDD
ncbi:MAG: FAD-dependent oxidoreductase [bacterium]|nr:FAD-dependent oxidoreductase [bacterium]